MARQKHRAKLWGDGRIYQKVRTKADGTSYTEPKWWLQYSVDGQVRRESSGTDDAVKAQRMLDARVASVRRGEQIAPAGSVRLSNLRERHVQNYLDKKKRSLSTLTGRWKNLAAFFDMDRKATSVTTEDLAAYGRQRVKDGASDSTVNRELRALKRGYRLAILAKVLNVGGVPSFPDWRTEPQPRQNFITPEQHRAIRAYLVSEEPAYGDALDFSMLCAWRKQQVLTLRWENILKDEIRVSGDATKGEDSHVIPLVPALREIIERRRAAKVIGSPWVFCRRDGSRIRNFVKAWRAACSAAGCAGTWYHDSRRSGVRNLVQAKVPQAVAMKISGHKTDAVFRRYNIVVQDDMRKALEAVSAPVPEKIAPKKHHRRVVAMDGRRN
jgi:integrase